MSCPVLEYSFLNKPEKESTRANGRDGCRERDTDSDRDRDREGRGEREREREERERALHLARFLSTLEQACRIESIVKHLTVLIEGSLENGEAPRRVTDPAHVM